MILYDRLKPIPNSLKSGSLGTARKWLLAISIITLISGFVFYAINNDEVEKQLREAQSALAHLTPEERDQALKETINMTWDEVVAHDRGLVRLLLIVNIALSVIYFGLWFWARKNPYAAALVALLLFLTVIVISAVYEPQTLYQGILIKILFIVALAKAVSAGREERRAYAVT